MIAASNAWHQQMQQYQYEQLYLQQLEQIQAIGENVSFPPRLPPPMPPPEDMLLAAQNVMIMNKMNQASPDTNVHSESMHQKQIENHLRNMHQDYSVANPTTDTLQNLFGGPIKFSSHGIRSPTEVTRFDQFKTNLREKKPVISERGNNVTG